MTTTRSRLKPFDLMVMLNETDQAVGDLYWDDGDTIDTYEQSLYNYVQFEATANSVRSIVSHWNYNPNPKNTVGDVTILGVARPVTTLKVNGEPYANFTYNENKKVLFIRGLNLLLKDPFWINYQ